MMRVERLNLEDAVSRLLGGGVIAFPTETSYALSCLAQDSAAVGRLLKIKARPDGKPLPVLMTAPSQVRDKYQIESPLLRLAERFWPGPLTAVLPAFPGLASAVTAETQMVGLRDSAHPVARLLVRAVGLPLVATSANRSGQPAATSAQALDEAQLEGLEGILEGDEGVYGGASTVVGLIDGDLHFFREGRVARSALDAAWQRLRAE